MGLFSNDKVKRLKDIPNDLVTYITIEGEAVKDKNDKLLITSYAQGKLKTIDWYIQLIDARSEKYIVPHSRDYLVDVRNQIRAAVNRIMARPVPERKN